MKSTIGMAIVGFAWISAAVAASSSGDAAAGGRSAERICSECHAVGAGEGLSPHPQAPPFQVIANARGKNEIALKVWFQVPHRSMPEFVLAEQESEDLIAYILSLRKTK